MATFQDENFTRVMEKKAAREKEAAEQRPGRKRSTDSDDEGEPRKRSTSVDTADEMMYGFYGGDPSFIREKNRKTAILPIEINVEKKSDKGKDFERKPPAFANSADSGKFNSVFYGRSDDEDEADRKPRRSRRNRKEEAPISDNEKLVAMEHHLKF
jgi:hypothetical protein